MVSFLYEFELHLLEIVFIRRSLMKTIIKKLFWKGQK